jgi:tryptophan synthase alpha subunit
LEQNTEIIEDIDEFLELLEQCDIDGIIEIDEMLELIDQLRDVVD